ncbi:Phosphomannomutase/phosphoglucomutase [Andreprevotia sp. IGB-42]|uniref:phosphomannomutase/phosphoglucomutase n=1 Tax=Andreprevotia sp. IGB-42 TaxID=2497473 RepID=UPI001358505F|nr:phosphomannomutase/phosphoglucomutase [Andreprevotia sp. IGB-42]KAF0812183.1 Phosphomannomutase/phosphoglucomutase [Andreprevotia sp. IGB-42]
MALIPAEIFKAYDVRARTDLLTPDAAWLIGRALGCEATARGFSRMALGRDGRLSSPALTAALARGLTEAGMQVLDLGLAATPLLYFAANHAADGCGVVVTGSHNPPEYNGIKIMLGGEALGGAFLQALRNCIETDAFTRVPAAQPGSVRQFAVADDYFAAIAARLPLAHPLKIVVDCGSGVAGAFAPALYRRMGCEVIELYCEVDGHFPHHHPDPQNEANLLDLKAAVAAHGAHIGLAFDGDGDRLGVVTRRGATVPGDRLLMLFAAAELAEHGGGHVLFDVKSSRAVAAWVARHGGTCEAIPTGHTHMKKKLRDTGALLAGELSGHFAFAGWRIDDALYAGAKLLRLLAAGLDIDAELAGFPTPLTSPELQIPLAENGHALVARIAAAARFPSAERVADIDGLRIEYPDGFGLIRASNTQPLLTLRLEADNAPALWRIRSELAAAIAPLILPDFDC